MSSQTVGSFLFDFLYSKGVDTAFGIPGDFVLPTFRWLNESPIRLITMTHEPAVGFAADGYARVRNGLGVAVVTYCVGGLNMLNSVACAYAEKSPILVISGGPSPNERRNDSLIHHKVRTFDTQRKIYEEVTCANAILSDPETAAGEIIRVVEEVTRQCRPGYIEVPYDIVDLPIRESALRPRPEPQSDPEMLEACLHEAEEFINRSKHPVILAGVELHRHGLTDLAAEVAQKFNLPVAADLLSKSVVDETEPLYIGVYSGGLSEPAVRDYIDGSDCVIMLGTFISDIFLGMNTAEITRRNSILVTTEEARIGLHSYDGVLFRDFLEGLRGARIAVRSRFDNPNPARQIRPLAEVARHEQLTVERFFEILSSHLSENSTLICDTGDALLGAIGIRTSRRRNFIADAYYLSMGFAVPASIGVMTANPETRAFTVVGDGAFQMTGTEISTAAKLHMAPIVMVINNDGYGTQRRIIDGPFNEIHRWDYTKVTDLIPGGHSARVETTGQFDDVLRKAVASDQLTLIEVVVPREDCSEALRRLSDGLSELRDRRKQKS